MARVEITPLELSLAAVSLMRRSRAGDTSAARRLADRLEAMAERMALMPDDTPLENLSVAERCVRRALDVSNGGQDATFWSALGGEVRAYVAQ